MKGKAIGLIEVLGLTVAIEAADIATKTAEVVILGCEVTKGSGRVLLKIGGEVSAVLIALEAAEKKVSESGNVFAKAVLSNPHDEIFNYFG